MSKVIEYINLLLWIIFLLLYIFKEVKNDKNDIKLIFKEPFHFIRIDSLFFLSVFLIYNNFARSEVMPFLYLVIIITNIVYLIYDLMDNYTISKIKLGEYIYYIMGIFLIIGIVLYNITTHNYLKTLMFTLIINCLIPTFVSVIRKTKKHVNNLRKCLKK